MGLLSRFKGGRNKKGQEAAVQQPASVPPAIQQQTVPPQAPPPPPPQQAVPSAAAAQGRRHARASGGAVAPGHSGGNGAKQVAAQLPPAPKRKEERLLDTITKKREQVERLEKVIKRHEDERKAMGLKALEAKKQKRMAEAARLVKQVDRLKKRIENHDNQLQLLHDQLAALEDAGSNMQFAENVKEGTTVLNEVAVDQEELEDALADARDSMQVTQEATNTLKADVGLYGNPVDTDDLLAELEEEMGEDLATEATNAIPDVPLSNPTMPAELQDLEQSVENVHIGSSSSRPAPRPVSAAPSSAKDLDDQLKQLEADINV